MAICQVKCEANEHGDRGEGGPALVRQPRDRQHQRDDEQNEHLARLAAEEREGLQPAAAGQS